MVTATGMVASRPRLRHTGVSVILVLSIAIGIAAMIRASVLHRRNRDWRTSFLIVALALMTIHFTLGFAQDPALAWTFSPAELMHLVLSVIAFSGIYILDGVLRERERADLASRERELRLRMLLEQLPAMLWTTDKDLVITSSAGSGLKAIGLEQGQLVGVSLFEYLKSDDPDYHPIAQHRRALRGESITYDFDWKNSSLDVRLEPLLGPDGEVAGTIGTALDVTRRLRTERLLRRLAVRLQTVREEERTAIAHEIHDELGQALTGLKLDLAWLRDRLDGDLRERADCMIGLVDTTLDNSRKLAARLRPSVLDDLGLAAAIESHAHEFAERTGCQCDLDLDLDELAPEKERDTAVFRILQEALTNVTRHAGAKQVRVRSHCNDGAILLEIEDDGSGIDEADLAGAGSLGLLGMRERARALGGSLDIRPGAAGGTVVSLAMPLGEET